MKKEMFTIGHSTRTEQEFIELLRHYKIEVLFDVRHFPMSRHNPQFNNDHLEDILPRHSVEYYWLEDLGGFRKGGYKAYTKTTMFKDALTKLVEIANEKRAAFMCAELLWFKCHRRYIADALKRKGYMIWHIWDERRKDKHMITKRRTIKCD